jgi:signal transduction histidine kinase
VANLLDLSLLERRDSNVRLTPVDLGLSIARAIEGAPAPSGKSVTTELETASWVVLADPVQLDRVFTNLITNAYRYGGSQIRIAAQRDGGSIIVDVSDNGEGVPADIADKIFLPFVRGKMAGEVGGSGVGLTLCRRIVEALGGVIWYDSTTPGSHFKFRLREYK